MGKFQSTVASRRKPEIILVDYFLGTGIDFDGDGLGDKDHGDAIFAVVQGLTGITPLKVNAGSPSDIKEVLAELLARKDVSNLYLNFSVRADNDPGVIAMIEALADRGAKIYIAAGNTFPNDLAVSVKPHPNIHVVGATSGLVGAPASGAFATIPVAQMTDRVNGTINVRAVPGGGFDLTNDGRSDVSNMLPDKFSAAGQQLSAVDRTAEIVGKGTLPGFGSESSSAAVASVGALRQKGLISATVRDQIQKTTGLSQTQIDKLYVNVGHLVDYEGSFGNMGGVVLYSVSTAGKLDLVRQESVLGVEPASSWAAAQKLSSDVNAALRQQQPGVSGQRLPHQMKVQMNAALPSM
jgi:hypothetical protein